MQISRAHRLFIPFFLIVETLALGWAAHASGQSLMAVVTPFSVGIAVCIVLTGLLPAFVKPSTVHTLIACFGIFFASILIVPFEVKNLPPIHPLVAVISSIPPLLWLRLINGAGLLSMMMHIGARFPFPNPRISRRFITANYIFAIILLFLLLFVAVPFIRIPVVVITFLWLTCTVGFFFWSLLRVARDETLAGSYYAQQARVVFFSIASAESLLLVRVFGIAFKLDLVPYNVLLFTQLFIPVGITYAVLKHDLFGIDRVIRRTLLYGALSLLLLTLYFAVANALAVLLQGVKFALHPFAPVVSLLVAAAVFEPTRRFTQQWLDRLLYPDRIKFQNAIQEVQTSLARVKRREEIVHLLTSSLPQQIGAGWATVTFFPAPDIPPAQQGAPAWNTRLVAGNIVFGGYWLGPRNAGPHYDVEERVRLQALLQQAALAMAYANAYESLYALNRDLETRVREQTAQTLEDQKSIAAYRERQRLARDLHDSVTQSLFGLHLTARGLKSLAPEPLKKELGELESLAGSILREMRLLLDQLRNPSKEETLDLAESVRGQCEALANRTGPEGGPLLNVMLDAPDEIILSASIGGEVSWIVREALQNVLRHSESRTAKITINIHDVLYMSIQDDGKGFDTHTFVEGRYGLRGMRERVLALGGEFNIESNAGRGTILSFKIPITG